MYWHLKVYLSALQRINFVWQRFTIITLTIFKIRTLFPYLLKTSHHWISIDLKLVIKPKIPHQHHTSNFDWPVQINSCQSPVPSLEWKQHPWLWSTLQVTYWKVILKTFPFNLYRCTVHFAESLHRYTNQCTHLNCLY